MVDQLLHRSHPEILKRLNRAAGHLRGIIGMMESNRSCLDIVQQLHAVEKAVAQAKRTLIQDHIDHCLEQATDAAPAERQDSIREFKKITKYL